MFEELGISFGTALIVLLALYFIIKWAVKNGIIILKLYLRKYYPKIKKYCHLIVTRHRKSQESP